MSMTGIIRVNQVSISVPTYIVKQCAASEDDDFQTKEFLNQVRAATKKPSFSDLSGAEILDNLTPKQKEEIMQECLNRIPPEEVIELTKMFDRYC